MGAFQGSLGVWETGHHFSKPPSPLWPCLLASPAGFCVPVLPTSLSPILSNLCVILVSLPLGFRPCMSLDLCLLLSQLFVLYHPSGPPSACLCYISKASISPSSCGPLLPHCLGSVGPLAAFGPSLLLSKERRGESGASQRWGCLLGEGAGQDGGGGRSGPVAAMAQERRKKPQPGAPGLCVGLYSLLTLPSSPKPPLPRLPALTGYCR